MAVGQCLFDFVGSECRYLVLLDTPGSLPPEEIYEKYQKSVVLIYQKTAYVASVGDKLLGEYMGDDSWNYFYLDDKVMCVQRSRRIVRDRIFHFYRW